MTQHGRNTIAISLAWRGFCAGARIVLVALGLLISATTATAAERSSKTCRVSVSRLGAADDLDLEIHVRSELGKFETLRRLSVHVADGIAQLFGPVPSTELKKKAIEIASAVPGVLEVRTEEVYLAKPRPAPSPLMLPKEDERPTQTQSASPNSLSGVVEALPSHDPPSSLPTQKPAIAPTIPVPQRVTLLAPESITDPPRASEPAVLTANPHRPSSPSSLAVAVERLRQGTRRFHTIRTEVRGSTVRVLTGNTAGSDVMAFVQAVRRLPGVQQVILKDTSTRPN